MGSINELLDSIRTLQEKRDATVETYNDRIESLMGMLEARMKVEGKDSLEFNGAIAFYRGNTKVDVQDWDAVMKYVKEKDAFDILQRRISPAQLEARINAGDNIKGVKISHGKTLIVQGKKNASAK